MSLNLLKTIPVTHLGAFESTKIHGSGRDILATTRHIERWRSDLTLLKTSGLNELRYSIPWHRIEKKPGCFDFTWIDRPMKFMREQGMRPIVDLLHHTSFPDWLTDGFANPQFPRLYARFVKMFAERYEWVDRFTVFNEPLATTLLCSYTGTWYPHGNSDQEFVCMAIQVAKAICLSEEVLARSSREYESVYIDTCEHHRTLDRRSAKWVTFANRRRFLLLDLILGAVDEHHPLFSYLEKNGAARSDLAWLKDHQTVPDVLGLDYYPHSEMEWFWNVNLGRADIAWPIRNPLGFAEVAAQYVARYALPVMLTETNIRGTIHERITWLRFMEEQTQSLLRRGTDVRGFCWYPSIDSTDWCHVCTRSTNAVDPQGIWCLDAGDERWMRHGSELSDWYSKLARGVAGFNDLPAYRFNPEQTRGMSGYTRLMKHWRNWSVAPGAEKAA